MLKQQKTEEQLKAEIFSTYSCYLDEPSSDRRQVYFSRICTAIISWCTGFLGISANEMGLEIYNAVLRLVKGNNNVPEDEKGFFKYLKKTLYTAEKEYYRNNVKSSTKIPRNTRKRLRMVEDIIITKESNVGRKLSEAERRQCISEWFGIAEYSKLLNLIDTGSLEFSPRIVDDDNEIDLLNSKVKPPYMENASISPEDEFFVKFDVPDDVLDIINALKLVLQNTQERSRECYRALFTVYCIEKSIDFEGLNQLLDNEILDAYRKDGKKPKQHEIYMKYHPEAKKASADSIASKMVKDFLGKLNSELKYALGKRGKA